MQNTHLKIWLLLSLLTSFFHSSAQSPQQLLQKADSLFNAKNYQASLTSYQSLFMTNYGSPAAYLKAAYLSEASGRETQALIYLYRYFLRSNDPAAYTKILELAKKQDLNGYERTDNDRLLHLIFNYTSYISIITATIALLLIALMSLYARRHKKSLTTRLAFVSLLLLTALFLFNNFAHAPEKAVINSADAWLMKGPSPAADRLALATPGEMVAVVDQTDVWVQIKFSDGKRAYVKNNLIIKI
jgi:hypothetical protein